ncbi:hypothetical protein P7C70_g6271, partial [Phenoliferia sp. Uapishka_3]
MSAGSAETSSAVVSTPTVEAMDMAGSTIWMEGPSEGWHQSQTVHTRRWTGHSDEHFFVQAKNIAKTFIATADTSNGPVTQEIITFHLVPDIRKSFNKLAKEVGCTAKSRQLTREEQDKVNKSRKSLMYYTSLTVTPAAQAAYIAKNGAPKPAVVQAGPAPKAENGAAPQGATEAKKVLGVKRGANQMAEVKKAEPAGKKAKV